VPVDHSLLIRAFVTVAADNGGRAWLVENLTRAALAMAAGQPKVKMLSLEGQSHSFDYDLSTVDLVTVLQGAIDQIDGADDDAAFDPSAAGVLIPRFSRFSA